MAGIKREPGEDINHFFNRLPKGAGAAIGEAGGGKKLSQDLIKRFGDPSKNWGKKSTAKKKK